MNKEQILVTLQYIYEWSIDPLTNQLEVGFRHSPLGYNEKIQRYKDFIDYVNQVLPEMIKALEET